MPPTSDTPKIPARSSARARGGPLLSGNSAARASVEDAVSIGAFQNGGVEEGLAKFFRKESSDIQDCALRGEDEAGDVDVLRRGHPLGDRSPNGQRRGLECPADNRY